MSHKIRHVRCLIALAFATCCSVNSAVAQTFRYPLDNWVETCDFAIHCVRDNHLGDDGQPKTGAVVDALVLSPATGVVKEVRNSRGYGGIVVIEAPSDIGPVTIIVAHMRHGPGDLLAKNGPIAIGAPLGRVAPKWENGGDYEPHTHIGIHRGGYASTIVQCAAAVEGKEWVYAGYTKCPSDVLPQWLDPGDFISARLGAPPAKVRITSVFPTITYQSFIDQNLVVFGEGFQGESLCVPGATVVCPIIELRFPDKITVAQLLSPGQVRQITSQSLLVKVTLGQPGVYELSMINPDGGRSEPLQLLVKAQPIHVLNDLSLFLYNTDDITRISVNDIEVGQVGYQQTRHIDVSRMLVDGMNRLSIDIENGPHGGWTYGYEIRADDVLVVAADCGRAGVSGGGCHDDDQTRGSVATHIYEIRKGPVLGATTPTPHFTMTSNATSRRDGEELRLSVSTGESVSVTFADASEPGTEPITDWAWTVEGVAQTFHGQSFTHNFPPGPPRIVTLTLSTAGGAHPVAVGTVVVETTAPSVLDLPNTGEAVASDSIEPHWTLLTGSTCPTNSCTVLARGGDSFSRWLVPDLSDQHSAGQYVFRLAFEMTAEQLPGAFIAGRWATDDRGVDIRVNGVSTGQRSPTTFDFSSFTVSSGFAVGTNTLDFVVENQACATCPINPVALKVEFRHRERAGTWPMSGRDPQRSGRSDYAGPQAAPGNPSWAFRTIAPIVGDIVSGSGGRVYFVSDALYALNPDGTLFKKVATTPTTAFYTSPAIDAETGLVYVVQQAAGGWDIRRFDADLSSSVAVRHGSNNYVSSIIVDRGTAFLLADGVLYAGGDLNWTSQACRGTIGIAAGIGSVGAPAVDFAGNVYAMCSVILPGFVYSNALVKVDRLTGAVLKSVVYNLGAREPIVDANNLIRTGFQVFSGVVFVGGYQRFDANLNPLGVAASSYTSSRAAVLPDGSSTVRVGYQFDFSTLSARGARTWDITLPVFNGGTTPPSTDKNGLVFIGNGSRLVAVSPDDGRILWTADVGSSITTQPAIPADGVVYVGTAEGTVLKFGPPPQSYDFSVLTYLDDVTGQAGGLIESSDGELFGISRPVTANGVTSAFRVSLIGGFTSLGALGGDPWSDGFTRGPDGAMYVTTTGGANGDGALVRLDPADGDVRPVHSFRRSIDGQSPGGGLVRMPDGALLGMTLRGGSFDAGTIFRVSSGGGVSVVAHLSHRLDGVRGLNLGPDGAIYAAISATFGDNGAILRVALDGSVQVLHRFRPFDSQLGYYPEGLSPLPLVTASDGRMYGLTTYGGTDQSGVAFRVDVNGTFEVLHHFDRSTTGRKPLAAALVEGRDGCLYGTTATGGARAGGPFGLDGGTVFRMTKAGAVEVLHSFSIADGDSPGPLTFHSNGSIYATTLNGGPTGRGVLFELRPH